MTEERTEVKVRSFSQIDQGLLIPVYLYSCPHWRVLTTAREQYCRQCFQDSQAGPTRAMAGWMRAKLVGVVSLTLDPKTQELRAQVLETGGQDQDRGARR